MAVQGSLKTIKIPELFSLLHQLRKTGVLTLVTETDERSFLLHRGDLVYATAHDDTRRMGSYLVRLGLITEKDLNDFLAEERCGEAYFGQRLVEAGKLGRSEIIPVIEAQILDILGEALTWTSGAFQFDDGEMPFVVPDGAVSTHSVILEATRRADERNKTKSIFPDLKVVLSIQQPVSREAQSDSETQTMALVNGQRTVEEILYSSNEQESTTIATLKDLLDKGILETLSLQTALAVSSGAEELRDLPVAPNVPGNLFSILNSDCEKVSRIAAVLALDPNLAAKVLRAAARGGQEIPRSDLSVRQFANLLGSFELRSILVPEVLRGLFFSKPAPFWKENWEHSVHCAQVCQSVAKLSEYPYPEEAYIAGLLHNLGVFILSHHNPQRYRSIVMESLTEKKDIEALEEQTFGISHSRLGGLRAEKWNFPRRITQAIRGHHSTDPNAGTPLLHILSIACGLANEHGLQVGFHPALPQQYKGALKKLNLNQKKIASLMPRAPRTAVEPVA